MERVEAGATTQLSTMIRIFRILELLGALDGLVPEAGARPMDLLKLKGKERQRATRKKKKQQGEEPWKWSDET